MRPIRKKLLVALVTAVLLVLSAMPVSADRGGTWDRVPGDPGEPSADMVPGDPGEPGINSVPGDPGETN